MPHPSAISWFEIPSEDFERAKAFYQAVYEHDLEVMTMPVGEGNEMLMALLPRGEGGVGGSVVYLPDHKPGNRGPLLYLNAGDDLQPMLDRIEQAGGTVLVPKSLVTEEIGYMAIFVDSEGNHMALLSDH